VLLTNSGVWAQLSDTGTRLAEAVIDELPAQREPWRPQAPPPEEVAPLLGHWWSEGLEFVFSWRNGRLEASVANAPSVLPPAAFEPEGVDRWRTVAGRERGELLRAVRDGDGAVTKLYWATYPFLREPVSFGAGVRPVEAETAP
jgi:hypothetical protein